MDALKNKIISLLKNNNAIKFTNRDAIKYPLNLHKIRDAIKMTRSLNSQGGCISINQLIAYTTVILLLRILRKQLPTKLLKLLDFNNNGRITRSNSNKINIKFLRLNISKEGFMHQASTLFNIIPDHILSDANVKHQKTLIAEWVRGNIIFKP